jgi:hypothetical protein
MRVGLKNTGQLPYVMTVQVWSLIRFGQKIPQFRFILKIFLFSVWVPNSEERKTNPRKLYLNISARLVVSDCLTSDGAHDLVNRLNLCISDCRLVNVFSRTYKVKIN